MELYVLKPGDLAAVALTVAEHYREAGYSHPVVTATYRHMNWFDVKVTFMENDRVGYVTVLIVDGKIQIQ